VEPGVWVVVLAAVVGSFTAFILRTRAPGWAVVSLLAGTGAALGWGGLLLRADPGMGEIVVGIAAMSLLVPVHARVVLGPFGPRRRQPTPTFEILEHTADVGIQARGAGLEEVFAGVAAGLATLLGAWFPGEGQERALHVEGEDLDSLLAAWVDELLYVHEIEDAVFGGFRLNRVSDRSLEARVRMAPRGERELESVGVKAATYHRIGVVREDNGSWSARIYVDV
jgi:SHS2 domain-containing protein